MISYIKGQGYAGIGRVVDGPFSYHDFFIKEKHISSYPTHCKKMNDNCDDPEFSEYYLKIDWIKTVEKEKAYWKPKSELFTTPLVCASLYNQPKTIEFVNDKFKVNLYDLLKKPNQKIAA